MRWAASSSAERYYVVGSQHVTILMIVMCWWSFFRGAFHFVKVSVFEVFLVRICPHSVQMRKNMDQQNSEYGHFLHNVYDPFYAVKISRSSHSQMFFKIGVLKSFAIFTGLKACNYIKDRFQPRCFHEKFAKFL